jgi:hypothetical protein
MKKRVDNTPEKTAKNNLRPAWKKGQSGNPAGRPVGSISVTSMVKKKLEEVPEGQQKTYLELLVGRIIKQAIVDGDPQMIKTIWQYTDGQPKQGIDIRHEEKEILSEEQIDRLLEHGRLKRAQQARVEQPVRDV